MNPGGEPERDDTGLPPVDIEIPDDARELDRDVQAYYRELRAERRRQRRHRFHGVLARDGIVLPLLACCLILALITGTLLTVFTATSDQGLTGMPDVGKSAPGKAATHPAASGAAHSTGAGPASQAASGATSSRASSATPSATASGRSAATSVNPGAPGPDLMQSARPLPAGNLTIGAGQPVSLQSLSGAMLVLIPAACHCTGSVRWLTAIGVREHAPIFLVGTPATIAEAAAYESRLGPTLGASVDVALDATSVLSRQYPVEGLTVVLIGASAARPVYYANRLSPSAGSAGLAQAIMG